MKIVIGNTSSPQGELLLKGEKVHLVITGAKDGRKSDKKKWEFIGERLYQIKENENWNRANYRGKV